MGNKKDKSSFLERTLPGIIIGGYIALSATAIAIRGHQGNTQRYGNDTFISDYNKDGIADDTEIISPSKVSMPIFYHRKPTQEEIDWYSKVTKEKK